MTSKSFKALHKTNNPYSAWIAIGTYGSFNDALAAVLRKKKQGYLHSNWRQFFRLKNLSMKQYLLMICFHYQ